MSHSSEPASFTWAPFLGLAVGCLVAAAVFGLGGFLANGQFASGPRQPLLSAAAWAVSAVASAGPVVALPIMGSRIGRGTAAALGAVVAVAWFFLGFVLLAG